MYFVTHTDLGVSISLGEQFYKIDLSQTSRNAHYTIVRTDTGAVVKRVRGFRVAVAEVEIMVKEWGDIRPYLTVQERNQQQQQQETN